jgi:hypothetical protein
MLCCLVGLSHLLKCLAPAPPWVELDRVILPWSTLASGGEGWVLMHGGGSGFPTWVCLLLLSPDVWLLRTGSGLSSQRVPPPAPVYWRSWPAEGFLLVGPGHQNSLQHCPRFHASYLQNVNESLWPRLAKTSGDFPGLPLQAKPTHSFTPDWP